MAETASGPSQIAIKPGHCERLCAPIDVGTNSSCTPTSASTLSSKAISVQSKTKIGKYAKVCTCPTISVVIVVSLVLARIRYSNLKQPKFPDVIEFNSTTESFKAKEIKLQEFQKILDKSLEAANKHLKDDAQGRHCQKEKDERGYAMFGFHDFCLVGIDQVERAGDVEMEIKAEKPYASGDLQFTDLEYRGRAKWSWAFPAEDFNCSTPSYNFTFKISLPHPKTKKMELMEIKFPPLTKYKCNKFHRYAKHSRRMAKTYTAYSFRYLIQEFVVESFKTVWESRQQGKKKK